MEENSRPNPDELLAQIKKDEQKEKKGKLKLYLGMCAGVGKTFAMLQDASKANGRGIDVLIGYVETHGRAETEFLLFYLPQLPRKEIDYKGIKLQEMDLDEILRKKPKLVIVDELAHTNAPGSRHNKRYLDVIELLDNGIDVYSAVNVQHIESLADTVSKITGIIIRETVPDSILDLADEIEMVDISPDELLQRLEEGKVYTKDKSAEAIKNFFRKGNLNALRELALRLAADRVDKQVRDYMQEKRISGPWKTRQRILVGISSKPGSVNMIRDARRIAYTMEASWIAVHVENPVISNEEKSTLNANIELAKELGAEIIITSDVDVVHGIMRIARQENVTHIIIGKPDKTNFFNNIFKKDVISRILEKSGDIDIYISTYEKQEHSKRRFLIIPKLQSSILNYVSSALLVLIITVLCYPFSGIVGYQTIALILLLLVSLMPLFFGPGPVLLAATISPLLWNFFFVPPKFTFFIRRSEDFLTFVLFFMIAYVTGVLTTRIRQREKAVRQREERAVALYNLANSLSKAKDIDEVISESIKNVNQFLGAKVIILLSDENDNLINDIKNSSNNRINEKEFGVAQWVYKNGKSAGKYTDSLPFAEMLYYPLKSARDTYGVIGLEFKTNELPEEQITLLESFINQISSSIEREYLNETATRTSILEESDKLYKTLFDSISHELKTPIAAIMGASTYLLNNFDNNKLEIKKQLYEEINIGVVRLNRLVENLLDMTRLESGKMIPSIIFCEVQDLFNSAVKHYEAELKSHKVIIDIQQDIPYVKVDFVLIEQVIRNLLQNSLYYTSPDSVIELQARFDESSLYIIYSDNGPGTTEENLNHIFDKFYRVDKRISGGTGLGLSIVKGIIEAHKGTITASNKITGGLKFTIKIPQKFEKYKK